MVSFLLRSTLVLLLLVSMSSYAEDKLIVYMPSDVGGDPSKGPWDFPTIDLDDLMPGVPATPTNVNASDFGCSVNVTWDSMSFATSYKIWRRAKLSMSLIYEILDTSSTNSYSDTTAVDDIAYYYKVQACNIIGTCSTLSSYTEGKKVCLLVKPWPVDPVWPVWPDPVPTAPSAPGSVDASDGVYADKIMVSWPSVVGATYYEVWRSHDGGAATKLPVNVLGTSYANTPLPEDTAYSYQVKACNTVGCSALSGADAGSTAAPAGPIVPAAPTIVQATDGTHADKVVITYNASADAGSVSYYQIFRETTLFGFYTHSIGTTAATSFTDNSAIPGTQYYYAVTACNAADMCPINVQADGGYAGSLSIVPPVPDEDVAPAVPEHIEASDGTYHNKVVIVISAVADATSYEVYRSTDASLVGTKLGTAPSYITDDTSVSAGVYYYYRAKACNAAGCSDYTMPNRGHAMEEEEPDLEETVANALIAKGSYTIFGTFGQHDFEGVPSAFDWAFTTNGGTSFQLQGKAATANDVFGWKIADIPPPTAMWYMFPLDSDVDGDGSLKFDWVLAYTDMNDKQVYKLTGVSGTGDFLYSDVIDVDYTVSGDTILFTAP